MIRKLILLSLFWLPVQQPLAAIVDLELELYLTIDHIGADVPSNYADNLNVGDILTGSITALNVDDAFDGIQNTVSMVNHQLTIAGVSYDRASSGAGSGNVALVQDGDIEWFLFQTTNGGYPDLQYDIGSWRLLLPGWSQSSPTSDVFEIRGTYNVQLAAVPIPAAVWLFGSGLLGLIGIARRKTTVSE